MDFGFPTEQIREVQSQLRREAGLASYDPDGPNIPILTSLRESIAQLDPSPPYLRCKRCSGRLLRGLQSLVCVYCGEKPNTGVPPDPLAFKSTFGYRWLLESLGLDGSELVEPPNEESEPYRVQSASKDEVSVSDLLDFEIKWPTEEDKHVNSVSNQAPLQSISSVDFTGVDLNNFFLETKKETAFNSPEEQLGSSSQIKSKDITSFQIHEKPDLFEEAQATITALNSGTDEKDDNDSGWAADFQSASSGTAHENSKSFDPFMGSTNDISAHMDTVFGFGSDKNGANPKDDLLPPNSVTSDSNEDDLWNNFTSSVSNQAEQTRGTVELNDGELADSFCSPSPSVDWIKNSQWQSSIREGADSKETVKDFESLDAWSDFTSSSAQHPASNSMDKSSEDFNPLKQNANTNLLPSKDNLGEMDFGSFSQPDLFSDNLSNQSSFKEVKDRQPEFSVSNSVTDTKVEAKGNAEYAGAGIDISEATSESKSAAVESLMSQMHDLSFMLETSLSIPAKPDEFGANTQN